MKEAEQRIKVITCSQNNLCLTMLTVSALKDRDNQMWLKIKQEIGTEVVDDKDDDNMDVYNIYNYLLRIIALEPWLWSRNFFKVHFKSVYTNI